MKKHSLFVTLILIVALLSLAIPAASAAAGVRVGDRILIRFDAHSLPGSPSTLLTVGGIRPTYPVSDYSSSRWMWTVSLLVRISLSVLRSVEIPMNFCGFGYITSQMA